MSSSGQDHLRLGAVCALALAVSLPIALISLSKLVLLCTFVWLAAASPEMRRAVIVKNLGLHRLIYLAMAAFSLSAMWSTGSAAAIGKSLSQHGNRLVLPLD